MSSLPRKSVTGLPLKKYVLDTLNGLIDYLQSHSIKAGRGIDVRETASGYVIGLANPPSNPPQVLNAGGGADGIEASVTGGTASITLTGGTGSVNLVGTGSVTISGNTNNGNIEINATGWSGGVGFPDYAHPLVQNGNVVFGTTYPSGYAAQNVWLIGRISMVADQNNQLAGSLIVNLNDGTNSETLWLADTLLDNVGGQEDIPIMLPIPSNYTFELDYNNQPDSISLGIYPCI